jgi:hypothetical protein
MSRGGTGRDAEDEREPATSENSRKPGKLDEAGGATYRAARRGGGEGEQGGDGDGDDGVR